MSPATFEEIERKAAGKARSPEAVAGAAYWATAKAKYRESKHHSPPVHDKFSNPGKY